MARPIRPILKAVAGHLTTLLTLAGLAAVGWWGASTGWKLESPFAAASGADADDKGAAPDPARIKATQPPPGAPPGLRGRVEFASAGDVARAGLAFEPATTQAVTDAVTATGTVNYLPGRVAQISSKAAGTVWWADATPGQVVGAGDVLALIDAAEVGRLKGELLAGLTQAALAEQSQSRLEGAGGAVPAVRVTEARGAVEVAANRLQADRQSLLNLGLSVDPAALKPLSAAERAERLRFLGLPPGALGLARGRTESANLLPVLAPIAGVVTRRTVSQGEAVAVNAPLFVVASAARVQLELAAEERDAGRLAVGQTVLFTPDADPAVVATATLSLVAPEVDPVTRRVLARAEADNPGGRLRINAFGRGTVVVATEAGAVTVPESALERDGPDWLVFVRDGESAFEARRVQLGLRAGGRAAVGGVRPGEVVVTTGGHTLLAELRRDQLAGGD